METQHVGLNNMPRDLWAKLKAAAALKGQKLEQFVIEILRRAIR